MTIKNSRMIVRPAPARGTPRIGYVMTHFPAYDEPGILHELLELRRLGVDVEVFALQQADAGRRHDIPVDLSARTTYLPLHKSLEHVDTIASADRELLAGQPPRKAAALACQGRALGKLVSSRAITRLHAHGLIEAATVAMIASRVSSVPFSARAHASDLDRTHVPAQIDRVCLKRKVAAAQFVITTCGFDREHIVSIAGKAARRAVHRLFPGIDLPRFEGASAAKRDANHILCAGSLVEKKGIVDLITACAILHDRNCPVTCTIAGDGPLKSGLQAQIAALGLAQHVKLVGRRAHDEIAALMRCASVLVLPSVVTRAGECDGLPTVLLEAQAAGLPTIATRIGGIPEIVEHEVSGLLVQPGRPRELAAAIERVLDDASLSHQLSLGGRDNAERELDLTTNVAWLAKMLGHARPEVAARRVGGRDVDHAQLR